MDSLVDVAIVGGGLGALVAAYKVAKAGLRAEVILPAGSNAETLLRCDGDFEKIISQSKKYEVSMDYGVSIGSSEFSDSNDQLANLVKELQPDRLWRDDSTLVSRAHISDSDYSSLVSEYLWGCSKNEVSSLHLDGCLALMPGGLKYAPQQQMRALLTNLRKALREEPRVTFTRGTVGSIDQSEGFCRVYYSSDDRSGSRESKQRLSRAVLFANDPASWCHVAFTAPRLSLLQQRVFRQIHRGVHLRVVVGFSKPIWGREGFVHLVAAPDSPFTSVESCTITESYESNESIKKDYSGLSFLISGDKACQLLDGDDKLLDLRLEELVKAELKRLAQDKKENSPLLGHAKDVEESVLFVISNVEAARDGHSAPAVCVSQTLHSILESNIKQDENVYCAMLKPCKNVYFSTGLFSPKAASATYNYERSSVAIIESSIYAVASLVKDLRASTELVSDVSRRGQGWTARDIAFVTLIVCLLTFSGMFIAVSLYVLYALANSYYVQYPNGFFGQTINFISQCGRANAFQRRVL